jgi:branched-chain amino acid aminotransferase
MTATDTPITDAPPAPTGPFGSVFGEVMSVVRFADDAWGEPTVVSINDFALHPGTHALHYGSACFEGLKAHRQADGSVRAFRASAHARRFERSAKRLVLPAPPPQLTLQMIDMCVEANAHLCPAAPGSLYLRPTLLGTDINIGSAAHASHSAIYFVLASPVGEYLPPRPLTILVERVTPRTTPQFGSVKAGANYAMALPVIEQARHDHEADQVLFAPGGVLEETGAANVMLIDGNRIVTPVLSDAFLHGVTRDSLLQVARSLGWTVEERDITVDGALEFLKSPTSALALTGTAAIIGPVGTLVVDGVRHDVAHADGIAAVKAIRARLVDMQTGASSFDFVDE